MSYRSLLVLLDQDPLCVIRTRLAMRLARLLDCSLLGLAPTGVVELPASPAAAAALAHHADSEWERLHTLADKAARRFADECRAARFRPFETIVDMAVPAESLVRHAHCHDLTVLTQADPRSPEHRATRNLVEHVVLHSARPTLVLPYADGHSTFGTRALVAWDGSREAGRALADAMPLLQRAAAVQVVCWDEAGLDADAMRVRLQALQGWLLRHHVRSEARLEAAAGTGIADALLSHAAEMGADLIVMGAYGHARWAERVLGGATRGLLGSMTVPVLMSR